MKQPTEDRWYLECLACPDCGEAFAVSVARLECRCGYQREVGAMIDLTPMNPRARLLEVEISTSAPSDLESSLVQRPEKIYEGPAAVRDSSELFSAVHGDIRSGMRLLDLGCGPRDQAVVADHYGLQYVGIDFFSKEADIRADGHALPFQEGAFDLVLSYAVLEHLYNPFVAVREAHRVLKTGGYYFGTVSQGEPFHDSFFHHTAWGTLHVLKSAGFRTVRLWHSYDTLRALAKMGRYPKLIKPLIYTVDFLVDRLGGVLSPRKFREWSQRQKDLDSLHRAASICFVASKDV